MILRSILVFLCLTIMYSLFIHKFPITKYTAVNQQQSNIIAKEQYLLSKSETADVILVGSSLTYRMKNDFLPPDYWNLAMGGSSFSEGIEIIKAHQSLPKVLLIETNIMDLPLYDIDNGVNEKISEFVHKKVAVNRTKNKFVDYFVNLAFQIKNRNKKDNGIKGKVDEKAKAFMYDYRSEEYSMLPDSTLFADNLSYLKENIAMLQSKGVCVILFEMPIDCNLAQFPKVTHIRNKVYEAFPTHQYRYLESYDCNRYETTDGIHLDEKSAINLADLLVQNISSLDCSTK